MNILPHGAPVAAKPDERSVAPVQQTAGATPATSATDTPASRAEVTEAVKKINEAMLASSQTLEFSIDEDSKKIVVKVIDQQTRELLRQMPSKEALEIAKSIDRMRGLLIDHSA